jgi:hypothetical protein
MEKSAWKKSAWKNLQWRRYLRGVGRTVAERRQQLLHDALEQRLCQRAAAAHGQGTCECAKRVEGRMCVKVGCNDE